MYYIVIEYEIFCSLHLHQSRKGKTIKFKLKKFFLIMILVYDAEKCMLNMHLTKIICA